ncbi:MAG: AMP-binding protein, partial [Acidobacteriota bacterium]
GLAASGVERGAAVGLLYPTGEEFFSAFFGTLLSGAVPVPLYPPTRFGRLESYRLRTVGMLAAAKARLALVDRRALPLIEEALEQASCTGLCLGDLPNNGSVCEEVTEDELALVQFSSGTTVDPKPVALTHQAVLAQAVALNDFWPDDDTTRHTGVSWLPLYHDMGLIGCVIPALERPSELTLIPPEVFAARPAIWLRAISRYGATVSPAPNFAYGLCTERIRDEELEGVDLSGWKVALNGAEPIAPKVVRDFCQRFSQWGFDPAAMTPVYGLAEAALAVTFSSPGHLFEVRTVARDPLRARGEVVIDKHGMELISVGRPLPGFAIEIRDRDGVKLPDGRVGTIWVEGPSLMSGYLHRPEATHEVLSDGWLNTGDLGFILDGELFITGRAKSLLIVRGQNHAPEEIESIVTALPGVHPGGCAAVSFLPEGEPTEKVIVLVERQSRANGRTADEIASAGAKEVLALTGIEPDRVEVLKAGSLPRTSSGKIRRAAALDRFLSGELGG